MRAHVTSCFLAAAIAMHVAPVSAAADPIVYWHNDPVEPDESVVMTGAWLDQVKKISVAPLKGQGERSVEILQPTPESLKFVIPADFPAGAYRVTLTSDSATVQRILNLPIVDWLQGDAGPAAARAGGWLRAFGRDIVRRGGAFVRLVPVAGGETVTLTPRSGDLWAASFNLPADMKPGVYMASVGNGDVEQSAASRLIVDIASPLAPVSQRFDARTYGAKGDGRADDTDALEAAFAAAAAAGGGEVYLSPGRFLLTRGVTVPDGVALRGESADRTSLLWPDFETPPPSLISGERAFSIKDLTLYASMHGQIVTGGFSGSDTLADAGDIRLERLRIRASAYRGHLEGAETAKRMDALKHIFSMAPFAIRLTGRNLAIVDCDVISSGGSFQLLRADGAVVSGNRLGSGRLGSYFITGSQRVIFENNLIFSADLQSTGGGVNTLGANAPVSQNIYLRGNTFTSLLGWDREALTTDGPSGYYHGGVVPVDRRALLLKSRQPEKFLSGSWVDALVFVAMGTGAGQWAQVARLEGAPGREGLTVVLDRDLAAPLDATSIVSISPLQRNYFVIENTFEDTGLAFQTYGTGLDHIVAGNVSRRTAGFFIYGSHYHHFQPDWHIQLIGNRLEGGNVYRAGQNHHTFSGNSVIAIYGDQEKDEPNQPPLAQAIVVRGNDLSDDNVIEIKGRSKLSPGVRDVIIEKNFGAGRRAIVTKDVGSAYILDRQNSGSFP